MKILIMMPLDEKFSYMATGIYNALDPEVKDHCFNMPGFMDYVVQVKICPNYEYAVFDALLGAKNIYKTAEKNNDDLIIIGNMGKEFKFDKIFNFQDLDLDLPFEDVFVDNLRKKCGSEEQLMKMLDLYEASDSSFTLHNCTASANFISKYIKTDPKLEEIEQEYQEKLKEWQKKYDRPVHKSK